MAKRAVRSNIDAEGIRQALALQERSPNNTASTPDPTRVLRQELELWKRRARIYERLHKQVAEDLAVEEVEHHETHQERCKAEGAAERRADRIWRLRIALADHRDRLRERHRKERRGRRCPKLCGTCIELDRLWKLVDPVQDMQEGA